MPVDRQRMRPWLEQQINGGRIQGLQWVDKEERIFQIPWMHAARHGWDLDKDAPLFMNWAVHTGKYHPGVDKPDPKTWKANFRCAMNSLPDIEEVKDKSMKRGSNAFRMYRMLSPSEKAARKVRKKMDQEPKPRKKREKNPDESDPAPPKQDTLPDSTVVLTAERGQRRAPSLLTKLTLTDPLDVCAVVEISTEKEESAVSSTQLLYPLQTSPTSPTSSTDSDPCHRAASDDDTHSEEDCMEVTQPQDLSAGSSAGSYSSVLRIPQNLPNQTKSFISSGKTNFWVTSRREESPLISYDEPPWRPFLSSFPFELAPSRESSSLASRATVIMQAMDLSSSAGKTQ